MQISQQTKSTLTLVLGIIIGFSMITLLYIMIAIPDANSPPQIAVSGIDNEPVAIQPQPPDPAAIEEPKPVQAEPQAEPTVQEPTEENAQLEEAPAKAKVSFIPILIIAVGALALGVGGFFLIRFIINQRNNDMLEDDDSEQDNIIPTDSEEDTEYNAMQPEPEEYQIGTSDYDSFVYED